MLSPARNEIIQALRCIGPCSMAELAGMLDRQPDGLYRHVDVLIEAGLVANLGTRQGQRRQERVLDVVADDFAIAFSDLSAASQREALEDTANSVLRGVSRKIRDAARENALLIRSAERNFLLNYELSWLTPEQFAEARELMFRLKVLMDAARPNREGRLYLTLTVAVPVVRKARTKSRSKKGQ